MSKRFIQVNHRRQRGLSLIELMIAITLGLLLLAGITQIFLANKVTFNTTDSLSRLEENGRFAMEILAKHIRMAGYADPSKTDVPPPFYGECDPNNGQCIAKGLGCTASDAHCTFNAAGTASDRLAVYYDPPDGASDQDCVGTGHEGPLVNVFWIANDTSNGGLPSLYCRGYDPETSKWITGSSGQPVAPGVENFQVLFGVDDTGNDLTVDKYVKADKVKNWATVSAVRIGLLMRSGGSGGAANQVRKYSVLDVAVDTSADKQPRMLYTTTIALNNVNLNNN